MAGVLKGEIRWCDFGEQLGSELAGQRAALVLSNDAFNNANPLAVVAPTTRTAPNRAHQWYVYLAATDSWASLRQVKTVRADSLQGIAGRASNRDLLYAFGQIQFLVFRPSGDAGSGCVPGAVWTVDDPYSRASYAGNSDEALALILDYNGGNGMAIVAVLGAAGRPPSRVAVPVDGGPGVGRRVALAHQVRALYAPERLGEYRGRVSPADLEAVGTAFLDIIA